MPTFRFVALDALEQRTKGTLEVESRTEAIGRLRGMGLLNVVEVEEVKKETEGADLPKDFNPAVTGRGRSATNNESTRETADQLDVEVITPRNLQEGDERTYDAIGNAIKTALPELLALFTIPIRSAGIFGNERTMGFFQKFLNHADNFTEMCCQESAKAMRHCSLVPEVRGTPTVSLAKEIRQEVFKSHNGYLESWQGLKPEIEQLISILHGENLDPVRRYEGQRKLKECEVQIVQVVGAYLREIKTLPEKLIDYCCARCFGNQISLQRQQIASEAVQAAINDRLEAAIHLTIASPETKKTIDPQEQEKTTLLREKEQSITAVLTKEKLRCATPETKRSLARSGIYLYGLGFLLFTIPLSTGNWVWALVLACPFLVGGMVLRRQVDQPQEHESQSFIAKASNKWNETPPLVAFFSVTFVVVILMVLIALMVIYFPNF